MKDETFRKALKDAIKYGANLISDASLAQKDVFLYNIDVLADAWIAKNFPVPEQSKAVEITDEQIESASGDYAKRYGRDLYGDYYKSYYHGAKWMRDKMKSKDTITTKDLNDIDNCR